MTRRRSFIVMVAAAMIAGSCGQQQNAAPAVPAVDDTIRTEAAFPDDGLTHLILTPIAGTPQAAEAAETASTPSGDVGSGDEGPIDEGPIDWSRFLTPDMVADVPPGAALEARDGMVGFVDDDGQFVALERDEPGPAIPEPEPEANEAEVTVADDEPEIVMTYGNPHIDELAADPAVASVTVIGDGTFGVSVSDPTVIDPATFAIAADVPLGLTVDQYEPYQWALENDGSSLQNVQPVNQIDDADMDLTPARDLADGQGIVVAVVDSGVDFSHPDLENSAWSNLGEICDNGIDDDGNGFVDDCHGWDFGSNDATPFNEGADPHGTHVSGIITANRDGRGVVGVAPDARIMDLNVARQTPEGDSISGAAVTAALRYAVDNGADIINLSLGSQPGASAESVAPMGAAIDYAAAHGVLVVVAAGNNGVDLASLPVYPASFDRPNMIVVGASSPSDARAGFSNHNAGIVDVYAPGELILSTVPGADFLFMSGTSQASPATAAAAALVMQLRPEASLSEIIETITSSVDEKGALSTSAAGGRVNLAGAVGAHEQTSVPTELDVRVSGLFGTGNEVTATVEIATPPDVFDEPYRWELTLIYTDTTGAYAVVDHPVAVDGITASTGESGSVPLAVPDATTVAVGTTLPSGQYSLVIEAVATGDDSFRLGDAFVTTFEIPGDPEAPVDTTPPTLVPVESAPSSSVTGDTAESGSPAVVTSTTGPEPTEESGGGDGARPADAGGPATTTSTGRSGGTISTVAGGVVGDTTATTVAADAMSGGGGAPEPTSSVVNSQNTDGSSTTGGSTATGGTPTTGDGGTQVVPSSPAAVPSDVESGQAEHGEWVSTSVSPQAGYVDTATSVVIRGSFPSESYVWFGSQPGQVVHQTGEQITVRTPLRAVPGTVDITLRQSGAGVMLSIPAAFAFVGDDEPAAGAAAPVDGGSSSDGSEADTGGSRSETTPVTTSPASGDEGADTGSGSDAGSGVVPTTDRRARMTVGSALEVSNGLRGASVSPNPADGVGVCRTDPCQSVRR